MTDRPQMKITALTPSDVRAITVPTQDISSDDYLMAAEAAIDTWGLAGVGMREGVAWIGALLIAPTSGLPRQHPLAISGLDQNYAGMIWAWIDGSPVVTGRRLCVSLSRHLRGRVAGIDAQAAPPPMPWIPSTPSKQWLVKVGFEAVRFPPNRYRLDFANLATWLQKHLQWSYLTSLGLNGQPAPASRTSLT